MGRVDDAERETSISIYVRFDAQGQVDRATFRTFGCSACVAASSMATELLRGRDHGPSAEELEAALGGLPSEKRYCVDLVAEAVRRALSSGRDG